MNALLEAIRALLNYAVGVVIYYFNQMWIVLSALLVAMYFGIQDYLFLFFQDACCFVLDRTADFVQEYDITFPALAKAVEHIELAPELLGVANYYVPLLEGAILFGAYWVLAFLVWCVRHLIKAIPFVG